MSLFPAVLGVVAAILPRVLAYYRGGSPLLSSLAGFTLTVALFLVLITLVNCLNGSRLWEKVIKLLVKNNINTKNTAEAGADEPPCEPQNGLIAIKKENSAPARETGASLEKRVYAAFYLIAFLGIAVWRIIALFKIKPWAYPVQYRPSIVDALLLLVFPCVAALYLKMRDEDARLADRISRGILTVFVYTSCIYAAAIAAAAVLKINFTVILLWVYYASSAYLIVSLAVNILRAHFGESGNISLKSLYTIRYTTAILPALALALLFILFLSTTLFVVQPHQQAAVYHLGKLNPSSIKNEGLHVKFPWPIDKAVVYDVHRVSSLQIGYESSGGADFLWTRLHDGGEHMLLLGNGNEMAAVNIKIMYVIADLYAYVTTCTSPESVLSAACYNALMERTINTTLDSFLSVDRNSLSTSVLDELSQFCRAENLGFSVVQVIVESIHPPVDIADVYQNVVSASVDKTTSIIRANAYAAAKVIEAAKQSGMALNSARAMQHDKVSDARKEAAVLNAAAEAYRMSAGSYELAKNLELYEKIINNNKVYVFSSGTERDISRFIIGKVNTVNLADVTQGEGQ